MEPGEHNGTFRGHNPAFVTATATLEAFWADDGFTKKVNLDASRVRDVLLSLADAHEANARGRGMIQGIEFEDKSIADRVSREAFSRGLIIETAGPQDEVVKLLPPLTISESGLQRGLEILSESIRAVVASQTTCQRNGVASGVH